MCRSRNDARIIDGHTRLASRRRSFRHRVALALWFGKSKYYLFCAIPFGCRGGAIGLISLAVDDVDLDPRPRKSRSGWRRGRKAPYAGRNTPLNNWLRMAGPSFDASLALDSLVYRPRQTEGLASHKEKRPHIPSASPCKRLSMNAAARFRPTRHSAARLRFPEGKVMTRGRSSSLAWSGIPASSGSFSSAWSTHRSAGPPGADHRVDVAGRTGEISGVLTT